MFPPKLFEEKLKLFFKKVAEGTLRVVLFWHSFAICGLNARASAKFL